MGLGLRGVSLIVWVGGWGGGTSVNVDQRG